MNATLDDRLADPVIHSVPVTSWLHGSLRKFNFKINWLQTRNALAS